jgi:hypothetical protein
VPKRIGRLTLRSGIKGRPLEAIADHRGAGNGSVEFGDDPRMYEFLVESSGIDWSITVQETCAPVTAGLKPCATEVGCLLSSEAQDFSPASCRPKRGISVLPLVVRSAGLQSCLLSRSVAKRSRNGHPRYNRGLSKRS